MALPYQHVRTGNALQDIQKLLNGFGCTKFMTGTDTADGSVFIGFEHRKRAVRLTASAKGYAAAWLRENPWSRRMRCSQAQHQAEALRRGEAAVYSVLRDWVKAQVTAVETGVLSFEGAFLGHMLLEGNHTATEVLQNRGLLPVEVDQEAVTNAKG